MKFVNLLFLLTFFGATSQTIQDSTFVRLADYSSDFVFDMKYATADNFLKSAVYDCGECYLRKETVEALINANREFLKSGFRIKIFDCYRPLDVQKKMWSIVSNPIYVADPAKGSIHNRGGAVDLTLIDENGTELDMGTSYDHFGPEAAHAYNKLSSKVKRNRKFLRKVMENNGFQTFESEWWHYNLRGASTLPVSNFKWRCH